MANNFPSLSRKPLGADFKERISNDPTIRSPKEAGYVQTRARFTRVIMQYEVVYDGITKAERDTVKAFEKQVGVGSAAFTWTHPTDGAKTVRLIQPIEYTPWESVNYMYWKIAMTVEDV